MEKKKLKFGGISFGGYRPCVTIFAENHKVVFGKFKKGIYKNSYGFEVHEKKPIDFITKYLYLFFPIVDLFIFLGYYYAKFIISLLTPFIKSAVSTVSSTGIVISYWALFILVLFSQFLWFLTIYLYMFKGVRKWHGTEHKVIAAAENYDIQNAKKYSPIHERCGGTLLPTIFLGYIIWIILFLKTGFAFGQMTIITLLIVLNVKCFHKYDKFGIWFGKKFQKYVSVKEPDEWQLNLGKEAMENLLKSEQREKYDSYKKVI